MTITTASQILHDLNGAGCLLAMVGVFFVVDGLYTCRITMEIMALLLL